MPFSISKQFERLRFFRTTWRGGFWVIKVMLQCFFEQCVIFCSEIGISRLMKYFFALYSALFNLYIRGLGTKASRQLI